MLQASGIIEVRNGVRIVVQLDFCKYYKWLIEKHFYNIVKTQLPLYGAHITLVNPKIHKGIDFTLAKKYIGKRVEFKYNNDDIICTRVNYWMNVTCEFADQLKKELKVDDGSNYWGLHLTICNKKFEL